MSHYCLFYLEGKEDKTCIMSFSSSSIFYEFLWDNLRSEGDSNFTCEKYDYLLGIAEENKIFWEKELATLKEFPNLIEDTTQIINCRDTIDETKEIIVTLNILKNMLDENLNLTYYLI